MALSFFSVPGRSLRHKSPRVHDCSPGGHGRLSADTSLDSTVDPRTIREEFRRNSRRFSGMARIITANKKMTRADAKRKDLAVYSEAKSAFSFAPALSPIPVRSQQN